MGKKMPAREWVSADSALWRTCHIVHDIGSQRVPEYRVATLFPLRANEIAFAAAPISIDEFRAAGDGSYTHSNTVMVGTGVFGLALGAATLAGSAMGNQARRSRAQADAMNAWRPEFRGEVIVTSQGFYLAGAAGLLTWDWGSIDLTHTAGFNTVVMQGRSNRGPLTWRISSEWAELIFVLWALVRHPGHPQLVDGSWMPPGWSAWAAEQGYPPHPYLPGIDPAL